MEECAEIQVECSKIMRFDNDSVNLEKELGDLICLLDIAEEFELLDWDEIEKQIPRKRRKLKRWSNLFKEMKT